MPQIKGDSGIVKEPRVLAGFSAANSGQTSPATSTGAKPERIGHHRVGLQPRSRLLIRTLPTGHRTARLHRAHHSRGLAAREASVFATPAFGAGR
jgi:hypothetical protein